MARADKDAAIGCLPVVNPIIVYPRLRHRPLQARVRFILGQLAVLQRQGAGQPAS
jgi:hypothetical protein